MRSTDGPKSEAETIVVGPIPNLPEIRVAVRAATNAPMDPSEMTRPMTPGERPSVRTRKTMMIAKVNWLKKLDVAVQPA